MPINLINEKDLNAYLSDIVYHGQEMETFTAANFQSTDYVLQHKDAIVRSIVMQWVKHRMRAHLMDMQDVPFLTPVTKNDSLPHWATKVLQDGKKIHRFKSDKMPPSLQNDINEVSDFLYSAADSYVSKVLLRAMESNHPTKLRLEYLKTTNEYDTFEKALLQTKKWHEIMANKAAHARRDEKLYAASLNGTKSIMKMAEGMEIFELTTPEALDYESTYMGHCVGKGAYDKSVAEGKIKIFSLRDSDGMPYATFEVQENEVHQCKGKGNKTPVQKYIPFVQQFVEEQNFEIKNDMKNIGLIKYDGKYYSIWDLPKGLVIKGDLDFSGMELTKLPDLSHLSVDGYFNCSYNKLTSLNGCPQMVRGSFNCSLNQLTSLAGAPQTVGGSFNCSLNQLTSLAGAPQTVKRSFNCSFNQLTSLAGALQTVKVNFDCSNNRLASLAGAPQTVKRSFNCSFNQLTSLQGAPQTVGGKFNCSCNQLTSKSTAPSYVLEYKEVTDISQDLLETMVQNGKKKPLINPRRDGR